jgi:hypothetical protein
MRKLSSHYIFTGTGHWLKRGVIVTSPDGTILDLIDTHGNLSESEGLVFYDGIIVPSFMEPLIVSASSSENVFDIFNISQEPHTAKECISKGQKPRLILVTGIDFQEMKLTSQCEVKILI